ncbi:uncharacterized protein LOC143370003 [Andrena cerasifolii]|uniref:uncharacterized protein LOC143370003 n=1 Tax=Andrena cerasifolii TaxID=2819439 RepID=UPI004038037D
MCVEFQILKMCFSWGVDQETAIECLPAAYTQAVMVIKYANGVIQEEKVNFILLNIKDDSERLKGRPEYEVLHKYAMEGRKYIVSFIGFVLSLVLVYLTLATTLILSDYVSKNETEEKFTMYQVEYYFFDAQKHYGFTTLHTYAMSGTIIHIFLSLDTMYITFINHACALFAVTGYRLKTVHILGANVLGKNELAEKQRYNEIAVGEQEQMYRRLVLSIKEHKRALEYTKIIQSLFSSALFFQVSLNIISLSVTGVLALIKIANIRNTIRLGIWMMGQYSHLFFLCLPGQRLMDFSGQVYYDALDCMWHGLYTRSRVIYQFLIMNTITPITLTALKVMTLNLETFLSVTQAAMSYFTVLSSSL